MSSPKWGKTYKWKQNHARGAFTENRALLMRRFPKQIRLEKLVGNPGGQSPKCLGWGEVERPSPEHDLQNHVDLIGNLRVRCVKTKQGEFWGCGRGDCLSNQHHFLGLAQVSDARFILNQGVSDLALRDFPVTFQDNFFGTKMNKFPDPCI